MERVFCGCIERRVGGWVSCLSYDTLSYGAAFDHAQCRVKGKQTVRLTGMVHRQAYVNVVCVVR